MKLNCSNGLMSCKVLDEKVKEVMDWTIRIRRRLGMTKKCIQHLEAENFVWDAPAHVWELQLHELCNLNGLCCYPMEKMWFLQECAQRRDN